MAVGGAEREVEPCRGVGSRYVRSTRAVEQGGEDEDEAGRDAEG